eukprot:TRINITY_DN16544_c0_g1_i1.p1 TRINITY_DN16544_c0_g1~~TRINITY_DN16544_c0_g1_i1.p1  ORF type:complete len:445 (-),score=91.92 TRINITY_DN16544_c0_g1_i1:128-1462(-)
MVGVLDGFDYAGYGPLRVPELRWLCDQRGLSSQGPKKDLLLRLQDQDEEGRPVPLAAMHPPSLEPREELERLAEELASNGTGAALPSPGEHARKALKASGMLPGPGTDSSRPGHGQATPGLSSKAAMPVPPSQAATPEPSSREAPVQGKPAAAALTEDERTLRGLLEFFVCSDVQRKGQPSLLQSRYRDFVREAYDALFASAGAPPATASLASTASVAATAAAAAYAEERARSSTETAKCQSIHQRHNEQQQSSHPQPQHEASHPESQKRQLPRPNVRAQTLNKPMEQQADEQTNQQIMPSREQCSAQNKQPHHQPAQQQQQPLQQSQPQPASQQANASQKRPVNSKETRDNAVRRKVDQVVEAQELVCRLQTRYDATLMELEAIRQAIQDKAESIQCFRQQLQLLYEAEEGQCKELADKARLKMDEWLEGPELAQSDSGQSSA